MEEFIYQVLEGLEILFAIVIFFLPLFMVVYVVKVLFLTIHEEKELRKRDV